MTEEPTSKPSSMRKRILRFRQKQQQWCLQHPKEHILKPSSSTDGGIHNDGMKEEETCSGLDEHNGDYTLDDLSSSLPTEVHLRILSFLDIQSLDSIMTTNKTWYAFLHSTDAHRMWLKHCQRVWNLPDFENDEDLWNMNLINDLSVGDDTGDNELRRGCESGEDSDLQQSINLHWLLSKTPHHDDTDDIDEDLVQLLLPTTMNPLFGRTSPLKAFHQDGMLSLRIIYDYNSHQAFSARADYPLTRPACANIAQHQRRKRNKVKRCMNWMLRRPKVHPQWNAFVSPYSILGEEATHVTPRLVSYFEITVEPPKERDLTPELLLRLSLLDSSSWIKDCVVIGLAPMEFDSRMDLPGWDGDSFGYHSDTGGLYHGGFYGMGATQETTEPFGTGDTVGMGIDYVRRGVFVTKNGKLLGLFFDKLKVDYLASTDLYPVVGMDSKDTVVVNYGGCGKPFSFDLADYCQQQQQELPPKRRIVQS